MSSQWGPQKLLQGLVSHELTAYLYVSNLFLTQWIMAIVSQDCKTGNFELHNSLKLSFTNIWALHSNFVQCESFLESKSPDILALCETNLNDSTDSGNLSVRGYLPSVWKDSITYMHGLAGYMMEGLPFAWDLSLKKLCGMFLTGFTLLSILLLFPLLITFFVVMHGFWFYII